MDIASLQISVDSRPARTAADDLDRLTGAGTRTEKAMMGVGAGGNAAATGSAAAAAGSRAAASAMDAQSSSAQRLTAAIRSYAVIAVSGMSVMGIVDAADQWGQMASRIRMATQSVEEYGRVQARMVVSANATYRSITETREAFIQLSPVLRQMGMSLDESMDAIDAFSGLMVTNAASTERGAAALRALSVSLQKGKMDADQWITIYSSLDSIVDTIAAHSGVAAEEIRKLGAEGKLSVSLIAQALAGQLEPIMVQVEEMPTTVRDAMQKVSTAFTEYVGKANEANGVTAAMADGISFLAENLTTVLNAALVAGGVAFARYVAGAATAGARSVINAALARTQASEEVRLAQAHVAVATAAMAQARASALLAGGMAQETVAATALTAAQQRLAIAHAATATASRGMLAILGGPVGIAITAGLAATAFMTMGGSASAASVNIDTLASSLGELNRKQLELRQFELEDIVKSLEDQTASSGAMLRTVQSDIDALTERYGAFSEGMDNARRSLLEQEEAHNENLKSLDKARTLLNEVAGRLHELDGAARGAAGGVNALNAAMGFTEAGEKYLAQIQGRINALEDGGDPVKAATRWIREHTDATEADRTAVMSAAQALKGLQDAREKASRSTKASASATTEAQKAAQAFAKQRESELQGIYKNISAIQDQAEALEDQIAVYGLGAAAIQALTIARLEEQQTILSMYGDAANPAVEAIEAEIEARKRLMSATSQKEALDANTKAAEQAAQEWQRTNDQIGQSLTDALLRGFESGKSFAENFRDTMKNMFKTMILQPIIQPIMAGVAGAAQTALGLDPGNLGNMAGSGSSMGNIGSMFNFGGSMASTAQSAGSWLASSGMAPDLGANLIMNADKIGSFASIAGDVLGYGKAVFDITQGKYGSAAGTAIGTYFGGPVGAAIGSFVGGMVDDAFGGGPPKTRHGQRTTVDYADGAFGISQRDDRQAAGSDAAAKALAEASVQAANSLFAKVGVDAAIESFYAVMESSVLGDRNGVASGGALRVGGERSNFGVKQSSDMTLIGFGGWSDAEMLPRLATDIQLSILEAFALKADELPKVMADMLTGVDIRGLGTEETAALIARFYGVVTEVESFRTALETLPFESLKSLSFDAAAGLIAAAGGLENLSTGLTSYYKNFYSEQEQIDFATRQMVDSLASLSLEMPDVTMGAEAAKAAYRGLVEAQDVTTESGQQTFAALMALAEPFAQLVAGVDQLAGVSAQTAASIAQQRIGLENQLLQLQGNTVELRRRELAGLDASNHALQRHIWAMQDQATAASTAADTLRSAFDAVVQSGQAQIAELQKSFGATDTAMSAFRSMSQGIQNEFTSIINTIDKSISDLRGNVDDAFRMQYDQARAVIGTAIVTGQLPQTADLSEALRVAQQGVMGQQYSSKFEQERAYLTLANEMEAIKGIAVPELDAAKATLAQLEEQYSLLRGIGRTAGDSLKTLEGQLRSALSTEQSARMQISGIEAQIELAKQQHNTLLEIRDGVLAFPDALAAFASALAAVRPAVPSGGGGSYTPVPGSGQGSSSWTTDYLYANQDVLAAYDASWGLSPEAWAAYHYDTYGRNEGRSFAVGTNYVPYDMQAQIHQGERIIPAADNRALMAALGNGGGSNTKELERRVDELVTENRKITAYLYQIAKDSKRTAQHTEPLERQSDDVVVVY